MFQTVIALSMAFGSESVDGIIFNRSSSCSGGSCSSSAKATESAPAKPQEIKSPKVKAEAVECGRQPVASLHSRLKNRTSGCAKRCR
jgi:hypothetical protein